MDGLQLSNQNLGWMTAQYALTVVKTGGRLINHSRFAPGGESSDAAAVGGMLRRIATLPVPAG
jgi:hypothetical protein